MPQRDERLQPVASLVDAEAGGVLGVRAQDPASGWFLAAYGASELDFTWLRALVDVTFEALLMLRMHTSEGLGASAVTVLTPYCAACADPMAPSFETAGAAASGSRAVLLVRRTPARGTLTSGASPTSSS